MTSISKKRQPSSAMAAQPASAKKTRTRDPQWSLIDQMERQLRDEPPKQKGERTRLRIRLATAKVLEKNGYLAARVADITNEAGLAEGSFYVYFKDKTDAALDVLTELAEEFNLLQHEHVADDSAMAAIRHTNRHWFAICRNNAGLMRCILQLGDEVPAFAQLAQRSNVTWYEVVTRSVLRRHPDGAIDKNDILLAVHMLGSMMDELTRKLIVYPEPSFVKLMSKLKLDDNGLADAASVIWFRTLYPNKKLTDELSGAAARIAGWASKST
jgi:TetR/AcrR family transcriptional regulator, transcriptional repressor for nem operon